MHSNQVLQQDQGTRDRPTSHKPTYTSRAGIRMPSAGRLAGSEA
jgi:hypothetical protein